MILVKGSVALTFGGNKEPAALGEIVAMGGIDSEVKRKLIATIGSILENKLGIPRTRASEGKRSKQGFRETMPCLNLSTNVSLEGVDTSSILFEASSTVAKLIGKPEAYVMIVLKGSVPMAFGGTEQPAAYGELVSIGGLNSDVNKKLSGAIANILESKLSVPKSRFYLKFYDTKACQIQEYAQCLHALHQY
ncbi:UNVERIFIED_CONTAM: Macrophage migration inhibitory factor [Sesamum calycinum]|uniref:Macrophage migration inhibitory factor n=1 Tax=Sesamum calycinum TaxID=2727403 RepID=A0AAW2NUC9_9LAMI